MTFPPVANVIKLFMDVSYDFSNKLEHLSLASLSSLVLCLHVRRKHTLVNQRRSTLGQAAGFTHKH
jgi:hypothetical protein